ncbi:efflux RND transporter periplasmic adaptor subunit [Mesorhizobium sp. J428]|uniref:efflux RND transporter periplasmic adaptor subunit n=1 Tax=Mesorhizobium sp. J428 TaxID=2898440 RepID=UPI002151EE7B|nr:efflux RND transporter periplasmic adaptor subunit [Mesorhizobium sp. J428]MCR5857243.1 efflux RND transporter periplasmic adaptor subunit [Mesorhizobium sp. J428]
MRAPLALVAVLAATSAFAGTFEVQPVPTTEWKAVYGRIEARDLAAARARIGGTVVEMLVTEGDPVVQGQKIAVIRDDKLAFQVAAVDAQLAALTAQLERAQAELTRGQTLIDKGVVTAQRLDQLRTDVDVARNQIVAAEAQKSVIVQQEAEGTVLAPLDGRVLTTPVTRNGVVMAGEAVATVGGGGFYLRLAVPERHAAGLEQGAEIRVTTEHGEMSGRLAKIYPQIENGRVVADVDAAGLDTAFVDARVLVELPVGRREALLVPASAVSNRFGIDFIRVDTSQGPVERAVVTGGQVERDGAAMVEVVTGLTAGEQVVVP